MTDALTSRDIRTVFHLVQRYAGASQTRIGIACGMSQGKVSGIMSEGGSQVHTLEVFERIANGLQLPDTARMTLGLAPSHSDKSISSQAAQPTTEPADLAADPIKGFLETYGDTEEEMERRQLLQALAALGISAAPGVHALETIRTSVGQTFENNDGQQLDHWGEIALEYGYSYLSTPPEYLIKDLAADMVSLRLLTRHIRDRDSNAYREWCRIGGVLSLFMAKTLSNMGHAREARHWWQTAQTSCDNSDNLESQMWVRGERLIHGLYERRSPNLLVMRASEAVDLSKDRPCAGLATVSTARAQALVLAGKATSAEQELSRSQEILEQLPYSVTGDVDSIHGWGEDRLRYTEAWVYAHSGNTAKADSAARRAIELYPAEDTRSPAQIKLIQAFAHAQAGDAIEGVRQAQAAYGALQPDQRTTMITNLAMQVLKSVPPKMQGQPLINDYREQLTSRD
ncbi:tetratricopeptide repeat protein [Actinomadura syzygii]|uniref:Helix-turn-helix domain-containing protein n=1 Tax=Actinomadura syzygii TaxID=1427538 RepID=A0A5D0TMI9_9ACTN|nr:helix-turn-helix domain-containing protein [Actinomadura syzygii]TYC07308.1 helix-turn-helix domain-containing protein [Actinomadura syzygii]